LEFQGIVGLETTSEDGLETTSEDGLGTTSEDDQVVNLNGMTTVFINNSLLIELCTTCGIKVYIIFLMHNKLHLKRQAFQVQYLLKIYNNL